MEKSIEEQLGELLGYLILLFGQPAIFKIVWNYLGASGFTIMPHIGYWQAFAAVILLGFLKSGHKT